VEAAYAKANMTNTMLTISFLITSDSERYIVVRTLSARLIRSGGYERSKIREVVVFSSENFEPRLNEVI